MLQRSTTTSRYGGGCASRSHRCNFAAFLLRLVADEDGGDCRDGIQRGVFVVENYHWVLIVVGKPVGLDFEAEFIKGRGDGWLVAKRTVCCLLCKLISE